MGMPDDFKDIFDDVDKYYWRLTKKKFKEDIEDIQSGKLEGEWDIQPIDEPNLKGYVGHGEFQFGKPQYLELPKQMNDEVREPLVDVFEDKDNVKLYVELPGVKKDDIILNITNRQAEIKARNFHKTIELPTNNLKVDEIAANHKNGVLEVTIPKTKTEKRKQKNRDSIKRGTVQ
jgi:HSP20 family protein